MNKEQIKKQSMKPTNKEIEEARRFLVSEENFILPLPEAIAKYALIKSKEAYEAGNKYTVCVDGDTGIEYETDLLLTYDQWKESQKQEQ